MVTFNDIKGKISILLHIRSIWRRERHRVLVTLFPSLQDFGNPVVPSWLPLKIWRWTWSSRTGTVILIQNQRARFLTLVLGGWSCWKLRLAIEVIIIGLEVKLINKIFAHCWIKVRGWLVSSQRSSLQAVSVSFDDGLDPSPRALSPLDVFFVVFVEFWIAVWISF